MAHILVSTPTTPVQSAEEHLCFMPAFEQLRGGKITWKQYMRHILLHPSGSRHEEDYRESYSDLLRKDPFGYCFSCGQYDGANVEDWLRIADYPLVPLHMPSLAMRRCLCTRKGLPRLQTKLGRRCRRCSVKIGQRPCQCDAAAACYDSPQASQDGDASIHPT